MYGLPPNFIKKIVQLYPIRQQQELNNYSLSKFLVLIVQPFNTYQISAVYNSFSCKSDNKLFMASFDVSSLFANIPLDEIDYTVNLAFEERTATLMSIMISYVDFYN